MDEGWRVVIVVEAQSPSGPRSLHLDPPRGEFDLPELHGLACSFAEASN
jgi:hypothetical protein